LTRLQRESLRPRPCVGHPFPQSGAPRQRRYTQLQIFIAEWDCDRDPCLGFDGHRIRRNRRSLRRPIPAPPSARRGPRVKIEFEFKLDSSPPKPHERFCPVRAGPALTGQSPALNFELYRDKGI